MSDHHPDTHHAAGESYAALRTRAIEALLTEKGLLASDVVDRVI